MIIVRLKGGMGNQLFQYALGRALAIKYNTTLGLDVEYLLDRTPRKNFTFREYNLGDFNIQATIVSKKQIPFLYKNIFPGMLGILFDKIRAKLFPLPGIEKKYSFDPAILSIGPNAYLDGFWQSPKYFNEIADTIRKDITLKQISPKVATVIDTIKSQNSVCVHIRRGDYVGNEFHPVVDIAYYEKALEIISQEKPIDCLYVFDRDDIEWCKQHLTFKYPTIFVENDTSMAEVVSIMSSCNHFVMANSSLSWWVAWLGQHPQKVVVAPKQWFADTSIDTRDLIPPEWIRI